MKDAEKKTGEKGPKASRRSPQKVLDDIVHAAREQFKAHGYERTTTAAIARKAKVSESQLYRYFESKLDLFHEAIFHYVEQDIENFHKDRPISPNVSGIYAGTRNEIAAQSAMEMMALFRKNAEAITTMLFAGTYVPNAKGFGEIEAVNKFFEMGEENFRKYRIPNAQGKTKVNPNLLLRAVHLSVLANSVFRDVMFPPGIASEEEIDAAVVAAIVEGLSAFPS